jgi:hypothetical protein
LLPLVPREKNPERAYLEKSLFSRKVIVVGVYEYLYNVYRHEEFMRVQRFLIIESNARMRVCFQPKKSPSPSCVSEPLSLERAVAKTSVKTPSQRRGHSTIFSASIFPTKKVALTDFGQDLLAGDTSSFELQ